MDQTFLLTSYERLRIHAAGNNETPITDNLKNKRMLLNWNLAVSDMIPLYINAEVQRKSRTQFFDVHFAQDEYFPQAFPITAITSVESDIQSLFAGNESVLSNFFIGSDERSVVLDYPIVWEGPKGLKVVYTGGYSESAVISKWTGVTTGTPAAGEFAIGRISGAIGIIRAPLTATEIEIEVLVGKFIDGEIIDSSASDTGSSPTGTFLLDTNTQRSLAEAHAGLVMAAETQIRYMWKHTIDFENAGTSGDGRTTIRRGTSRFQDKRQPLTDETISLLQKI